MKEDNMVSLRKFNFREGMSIIDRNGEKGVITRLPFTSPFFGTRIEVDYDYEEDRINPADVKLVNR